ncbi:hypothetical protein [Sporomusa ovata]|uniref:hypothetical protein n=1 Tax=Sporomusa ovata TaxID=2378 RepID=UPI00048CC79B
MPYSFQHNQNKALDIPKACFFRQWGLKQKSCNYITCCNKGTDNIKGVSIALASTIAKNVTWTIGMQDLKIKDSKLTGGISDLGKSYFSKVEFFY